MTASLLERAHARKRAPLLPVLRELLWLREGARLLDVGGGTGLVAAMLELKGEVVVVEPNGRKVARGRGRRPQLTFVEAGAERLPFPEFRFDAAMALMTIHHWPDPAAGLAEVRRVLQPGGRLVAYEMPPSQAGLLRWVPHHQRLLEREDLARLLHEAGFGKVEFQDAPRGYLALAVR